MAASSNFVTASDSLSQADPRAPESHGDTQVLYQRSPPASSIGQFTHGDCPMFGGRMRRGSRRVGAHVVAGSSLLWLPEGLLDTASWWHLLRWQLELLRHVCRPLFAPRFFVLSNQNQRRDPAPAPQTPGDRWPPWPVACLYREGDSAPASTRLGSIQSCVGSKKHPARESEEPVLPLKKVRLGVNFHPPTARSELNTEPPQ